MLTKRFQSTAVAAFQSRVGLGVSSQRIQDIIHDKEVAGQFQLLGIRVDVGSNALSFYTTEYIMAKYPNLPAEATKQIVQALVGKPALAQVGNTWGVAFLTKEQISKSQVVESLIGALYREKGSNSTREFLKQHIFSRQVDVQEVVDVYAKLRQPRRLLAALAKKLNQEKPVARLLKESGRASVAPVFIVGMYSGAVKVGEGHGSSIKMAETRAVKDALLKHYLDQVKSFDDALEGEDDESFFE